MATPDTAPLTAPAGDTVDWYQSAGEYTSAAGYAVALAVVGSSVTGTATADGDRWLLSFAAANTTSLGPGAWRWVARATRGAEVRTIASGVLTLTAPVGSESTATTHAARMLAAIECVLEGRIPADIESYAVAGRSLTRIPARELYALRNKYAAEVAAERSGTGSSLRQIAWQLAG